MQTSSRVRILILVSLLLLLALLTLQACNRANDNRAAEAGGVFLEGTSPLPTDLPSPLPTSATEVPPAPTAETSVASVGTILSSSTSVPIYADADAAASVLEVYSPGSAFTVIEPSGAYAAYPVSAAGATWIRVRASDGMAGWAQTAVFAN